MNKKEVIKAIKALFSTEENVVEDSTVEQFLDVKTTEGRILRVEDMLVNAPIQEVTEDGLVDLEDGEYELEDGLKVVVAGGLISDLVEPEMEEEVEEEVPAEEEAFEETEEVAEVEEEVEATEEVEETEEVSEVEEEVDSELTELLELINGMVGEFNSMREEFNALKEENSALKERFNKFAEEPSEERTTTKVDFNKVDRNERLKFFSKK